MQKRYILAAATVLTGAIIALLPYYILPVCSGLMEGKMGSMFHMSCFYTSRASIILGILTMIAGAGFASRKVLPSGKSLTLLLVSLGTLTIVLPYYILPVCQPAGMACHTTRAGWVVAGFVLIVIGLIGSGVTEES